MPARRSKRRLAVALGTSMAITGLSTTSVLAAVVDGPFQRVHDAIRVARVDTRQTFSIPAGRLDDALARYCDATGVNVVVDPSLTHGKKTAGVRGSFSSVDALAALLAGTGLYATFVDGRTARIDVASIASTKVLATVKAQAGDYAHSVTNFKLGGALVNVPQSVTVVTQQTLSDQGRSTMADALRNVSGISLAAGEGASQGDSLTIRGYDARNDFYIDGMRDYGNYYRDTFDLSSIEVSQGASGAIFGRGSTGGTINQITKQPMLDGFSRGVVSGGSAGTQRATADIDVPLSSTSAFRVNVMGQHGGTVDRDVTTTNRWGLAPSVKFGIGTATTLTLDYLHLGEKDIPDYGIPLLWGKPAPVDRRNFYGFANSDFYSDESDILTATLQKQYSSRLSLRNQTRYASYAHAIAASDAVFNVAPPLGTPLSQVQVNETTHARTGHETFLENQTDATIHLSDTSTLIGGVEIGSETSYERQLKYAGLPNNSLLDPNAYQNATYTSVTPSETDATAGDLGAYLLYTGYLGKHWLLNSGGRWDSFDATVIDPIGHHTYQQDTTMPSGRAALTWKPSAGSSIYLSWGTSFDPAIENLVVKAAPTPPEGDAGYELGSKFELRGGLSLAAALFTQTQTNVKQNDLSGVTENIGRVNVNGETISLSGRITPRWQATGGLTLLNTLVVQSANPGEQGNPLANTPHASLTLWTTYDASRSLELGGGAVYESQRFTTDIANAAYGFVANVPGYWRYDAMAKYKMSKGLDLQLNGYNLTDANYIDLIHPDHLVPGAGRSFTLTADMRL